MHQCCNRRGPLDAGLAITRDTAATRDLRDASRAVLESAVPRVAHNPRAGLALALVAFGLDTLPGALAELETETARATLDVLDIDKLSAQFGLGGPGGLNRGALDKSMGIVELGLGLCDRVAEAFRSPDEWEEASYSELHEERRHARNLARMILGSLGIARDHKPGEVTPEREQAIDELNDKLRYMAAFDKDFDTMVGSLLHSMRERHGGQAESLIAKAAAKVVADARVAAKKADAAAVKPSKVSAKPAPAKKAPKTSAKPSAKPAKAATKKAPKADPAAPPAGA